MASGQLILRLHQEIPALPVCSWSPDGTRLAAATLDHAVWIRDAHTGHVVLRYAGHWHPVHCLAWSPLGRWVASADPTAMHVWPTSSLWMEGAQIIKRLHLSRFTLLAWSPDGLRIASVARPRWHIPRIFASEQVHIWDAWTGAKLVGFRLATHTITDLAWSPDGSRLATVGQSSPPVRLFSARSGHLLVQAGGIAGDWLQWTRDGTILTVLDRQGQMQLLHTTTGALITQLNLSLRNLSCAAWSPDEHTLAFSLADERLVHFWQRPPLGRQTSQS